MEAIAITGMGAICPLSSASDTDTNNIWQRLCAGQSGISTVNFELEGYQQYCQIGGQIKFDYTKHLSQYERNYYDKFIQFTLLATQQALEDALLFNKQLLISEKQLTRVGVTVGSGIGGLDFLSQGSIKMDNNQRISPFCIPGCLINLASNAINIKYKFKGPSMSIVTACATGVHSIIEGCRLINEGLCDYVIAGGSEGLSSLGFAGFASMKALALNNYEDPTKASRPFDQARSGFVMSEGAGVLVLEKYQHAIERKANIHSVITGYGMTSDGNHITQPDPDGASRSMRMALDMSEIDTVGHISAHATSTIVGDRSELQAIKNTFKDKVLDITISSTKGSTGHLLGASGALAAIFTSHALKTQIAPPTLNYTASDENAYYNDIPLKISSQSQRFQHNYALVNAFGFGGVNGSIVLRKYGSV